LSLCNRKLFFGDPMSMVIRSDLTAEDHLYSNDAVAVVS
jgi:hypothetical protein